MRKLIDRFMWAGSWMGVMSFMEDICEATGRVWIMTLGSNLSFRLWLFGGVMKDVADRD